MIGTRLPDVRRDRREGWVEWDEAGPGTYMKVLKENGDLWCWYLRAPNGDVATLWPHIHEIVEAPDGTITVSRSIVFPNGGCWHGFLRAGWWS